MPEGADHIAVVPLPNDEVVAPYLVYVGPGLDLNAWFWHIQLSCVIIPLFFVPWLKITIIFGLALKVVIVGL